MCVVGGDVTRYVCINASTRHVYTKMEQWYNTTHDDALPIGGKPSHADLSVRNVISRTDEHNDMRTLYRGNGAMYRTIALIAKYESSVRLVEMVVYEQQNTINATNIELIYDREMAFQRKILSVAPTFPAGLTVGTIVSDNSTDLFRIQPKLRNLLGRQKGINVETFKTDARGESQFASFGPGNTAKPVWSATLICKPDSKNGNRYRDHIVQLSNDSDTLRSRFFIYESTLENNLTQCSAENPDFNGSIVVSKDTAALFHKFGGMLFNRLDKHVYKCHGYFGIHSIWVNCRVPKHSKDKSVFQTYFVMFPYAYTYDGDQGQHVHREYGTMPDVPIEYVRDKTIEKYMENAMHAKNMLSGVFRSSDSRR